MKGKSKVVIRRHKRVLKTIITASD